MLHLVFTPVIHLILAVNGESSAAIAGPPIPNDSQEQPCMTFQAKTTACSAGIWRCSTRLISRDQVWLRQLSATPAMPRYGASRASSMPCVWQALCTTTLPGEHDLWLSSCVRPFLPPPLRPPSRAEDEEVCFVQAAPRVYQAWSSTRCQCDVLPDPDPLHKRPQETRKVQALNASVVADPCAQSSEMERCNVRQEQRSDQPPDFRAAGTLPRPST